MQSEGVKFNSNTDTEVVAALINKYYKNNMEEALEKAIKELKGSYALGILCEDDDNLYAVRCESPLILGVGNDEYFVTSDIGAILKYTSNYVLLGENEIVVINDKGYKITKDNKSVKREVLTSKLTDEATELCGYEHYMMKEIMEEPVLVDNLAKKYINHLNQLPNIRKYKYIH